MWWFWIGAALLAGVLAALVTWRAARVSGDPVEADAGGDVYRRQLIEIEQLSARGLLAGDDLQLARAEAGRRLLRSANGGHPSTETARGGARAGVIAAAVTAPLLALAGYAGVGSPDLADQPYQGQLERWRASDPASLGPIEAAAVLERVTRERPRDVWALIYLARAQAAAGQQALALRSLRRAAEIDPRRVAVWTLAGELQAESEGSLSAAARSAFQRALALDPRAVSPRYYLGDDLIARGERAAGLRLWRSLLDDLPSTDPRRAALDRKIGDAKSKPERGEGAAD